MHHLRTLLVAAALFAVACDDPTEGVAPATVTEEPAAEPAPAPEAASTLTIDTEASTFGFIGSKVTGSHDGHFDDWSGTMELADDVTASSVSITIQMATVQTDSERLTGHLRTDDFFDVANHPTATFESTRITAQPQGEQTHLVAGRLTLRGQTRTITFPATITVTDQEVRAVARFTIDRTDFGVSYRGMEDDLINEEVVIHFDVRAPRST